MIPTYITNRLLNCPKRYFVSYGTPWTPEKDWPLEVAARFPLGIVSPAYDNLYERFVSGIRKINPDIILLGYSNITLEPKRWKRPCDNPKYQLPDSMYVDADRWGRHLDLRYPEAREAAVRCAVDTFNHFPLEGVFLDNCSLHPIKSVDEITLMQMQRGLEDVVKRIRESLPTALIIANTYQQNGRSNVFKGLNGFMFENPKGVRADQFYKDPDLELPQIQMYLNSNQNPDVAADLEACKEFGAWYYAATTYSDIHWKPEYS